MIDVIIPCLRRHGDFVFWLEHGPRLFNSFPISSIVLSRGFSVLRLTRYGLTEEMPLHGYRTDKLLSLSTSRRTPCSSKVSLLLQAVRFTSEELLLFLDCDIRFTTHSLQRLITILRCSPSQRTAAYVRDVFESDSSIAPKSWSGERPLLLLENDGSRRLIIQRWSSTNSRPGFGNVICRRKDYISCGMHDARYFSYGWEDHDLLTALQLDGCTVVSASYAFHISHDDSSRLLGDFTRAQSVALSKSIFMDKYKDLLV